MLKLKTIQKHAALVATFLFIASFYGANVAKAQEEPCPTDLPNRTTMTIMVNGCPYEIDVCYFCMSGPRPSEIRLMSYKKIITTPECPQTLTDQQVHDYIESQIMTRDFLETYLCQSIPLPPPCPAMSEEVIYRHALCWYSYTTEYWGVLKKVMRACDNSAECVEHVKWCFNPITGEYERQTVYSYINGVLNCQLEGWQVNWPETPEDPPTDCYIYHTVCNPL